TSLADARTGICLAAGANPADVDPATGYNLSRHAYETARASWLAHIEHHGLTAHRRLRLDQACNLWAARRPRFVAGDDWTARASALHRK
ncbi:hypothetical protein G3I76_05915, partial [Streptomyces sp. SID11233]|nr:hypothetical protein [Streptomyces sp. SID11233]